MANVRNTNAAFKEKGVRVRLPYPGDWQVKRIELIEKTIEGSKVKVLLGVTVISEEKAETFDLLYGESDIKRVNKKRPIRTEKDYKSQLLPSRANMDFSDEVEARGYVLDAFKHLLTDKGYEIEQDLTVDLLARKGKRRFYVILSLRCDDEALKQAKKMIRFRKEKGGEHDYGLAFIAFQSVLGISLLEQERWISQYQSYFSNHRIGIYAVDNKDPNIMYPFSVYPKGKDLFIYFVKTSRLWRTVKDRYVLGRIKNND